MRSASVLALAALAGQTFALPQWGNWGNWGHGDDSHDAAPAAPANNVAVVTMYTTITLDGPWGAPTPTPQAQAEAPSPQAPAQPLQTWQPVASPAPSTGGSSSGGYMDCVSNWRSRMGLPDLSHDEGLQGNALKTVQDSNGDMVHELNPGSMAQVLAPGDENDFESVFVGGWLCEIPTLPGLDGICATMSAGWSYGGETGHADILKSTSYSKIGCALHQGIWACDLS